MRPAGQYAGRLLTTTEAADLVDVTPGTIRKWAHRGYLLPFVFDDGRPLYLDRDVYVAERDVRKRREKGADPSGQQQG